jgi:hypothetical protein
MFAIGYSRIDHLPARNTYDRDHQSAGRYYGIISLEVQAVDAVKTMKIPQSNLSFPNVSLANLNAERAMIAITAAPIP